MKTNNHLKMKTNTFFIQFNFGQKILLLLKQKVKILFVNYYFFTMCIGKNENKKYLNVIVIFTLSFSKKKILITKKLEHIYFTTFILSFCSHLCYRKIKINIIWIAIIWCLDDEESLFVLSNVFQHCFYSLEVVVFQLY